MEHKPLEPHQRPRAQSHLHAHRITQLQCTLDRGLEVPTHVWGAEARRAACTVVREESEDVGPNCCCGGCDLGLRGSVGRGFCCFDGEEEVQEAGGDEGYQEGTVVDYDVL